MKKQVRDKYGRGSAAANGEGFVDLAPGDTFDGLEARLRALKDHVFRNSFLDMSASIGSMRNANELAKHLAKDEPEEIHKFAAKNLGILFCRAELGIRHLDKKATTNARWIVTYVRVFAPFIFAGEKKIATITLKKSKDVHNFYSVEAIEINKDAGSERTPRGAMSNDLNSAPLQSLTSYWESMIAYYVGDVNRTCPMFVASAEMFSLETAAEKITQMLDSASGVRKTDLAVIILQKNEKLHIKRCLEKLAPLAPRQIFVVDCFSTDGSDKTAAAMGATVVYRAWPGLYAQQFNWALDNLPIKASWILRLDADEYLYPETCEEVERLVTSGGLPSDVTSLSLSLSRVFCGHKIRFGGTAHIPMVRFFKRGIGRCQDRAMDEHIVTREGRDYRLKGEFADDNLNAMDWWREKHRGYARREAQDALAFARGELRFKPAKETYYRMPRYLRAFIYFSIRYFLKFGFLDGYAGWMWNFWQGLWYRWIVDREIGRLKHSGEAL